MLTRFGSVLRQYRPTWRTAITWALVDRAKAPAVTMADNRTQAIFQTGDREDNPMAGPPVCLETLAAVSALRLAAVD